MASLLDKNLCFFHSIHDKRQELDSLTVSPAFLKLPYEIYKKVFAVSHKVKLHMTMNLFKKIYVMGVMHISLPAINTKITTHIAQATLDEYSVLLSKMYFHC